MPFPCTIWHCPDPVRIKVGWCSIYVNLLESIHTTFGTEVYFPIRSMGAGRHPCGALAYIYIYVYARAPVSVGFELKLKLVSWTGGAPVSALTEPCRHTAVDARAHCHHPHHPSSPRSRHRCRGAEAAEMPAKQTKRSGEGAGGVFRDPIFLGKVEGQSTSVIVRTTSTKRKTRVMSLSFS